MSTYTHERFNEKKNPSKNKMKNYYKKVTTWQAIGQNIIY